MTRKLFTAIILVYMLAGLAAAAETDKVVARVGSQDITERDVLEFIQPFGQQAVMLYGSEQGRKMIIDDVITMRLYALDGETQKLDDTPEFQAQLAAARRAMLAQASMRKVIDGITISDDEARKFYDDNTQRFTQPERVHARHILVSDDVTAGKVLDELKGGASFDALAKKYSLDPGSARNGGDLGEFPKGVMVPEFEKAAFELKNPGDISAPVKSQFGYHIIKLEEHIPASPSPFEQVKAAIVRELTDTRAQQILQDKAKELEGVYKVERF